MVPYQGLITSQVRATHHSNVALVVPLRILGQVVFDRHVLPWPPNRFASMVLLLRLHLNHTAPPLPTCLPACSHLCLPAHSSACLPAADELMSALQLPPGPFRRRYHFDPPVPGLDGLVVHSRGSGRAQWAAQLCLDAGCK